MKMASGPVLQCGGESPGLQRWRPLLGALRLCSSPLMAFGNAAEDGPRAQVASDSRLWPDYCGHLAVGVGGRHPHRAPVAMALCPGRPGGEFSWLGSSQASGLPGALLLTCLRVAHAPLALEQQCQIPEPSAGCFPGSPASPSPSSVSSPSSVCAENQKHQEEAEPAVYRLQQEPQRGHHLSAVHARGAGYGGVASSLMGGPSLGGRGIEVVAPWDAGALCA